jgi:hypothetical protein
MQSPYKSLIYKGFLLFRILIFTPVSHTHSIIPATAEGVKKRLDEPGHVLLLSTSLQFINEVVLDSAASYSDVSIGG